MRELRYSIRQTVPPFLLEGIERMRGTVFAMDTADIFYEAVGRYVVYESEADAMPPELQEVTLPPSCAYDKSFGYPCSAEQEKKIEAAAEAGESLSTY